MWNQALATLWCTFCRPHLPKAFRTLTFWSANRALVAVSCTFCRPHLPKVLRPHHFCDFECKQSSRHSPVYFSPTTFPHRAPNLLKQTRLLRRPLEPHCPKKLRPRVFSPLNSFVPYSSHTQPAFAHFVVTNCFCSLCCSHDDDMMNMMTRLPLDIRP